MLAGIRPRRDILLTRHNPKENNEHEPIWAMGRLPEMAFSPTDGADPAARYTERTLS
jgi:hypothetical protein